MELRDLSVDEEQRLFELYRVWCENHGLEPKLNSFGIWLEEQYED